ncbi:hypothetical protein ACIRL2_29215 [Embleya sp. NPDC127516]|uniref:zinc finger domain-containing protein n=1 Tax=Embleya sp. NPDC127516 TaxID=3363990 RepID=UPI00382645E3
MKRHRRIEGQQRIPMRPERAVPCPHCGVQAHQPCTDARGRALHNSHGSRFDAAEQPIELTRREPPQ